ncbi:MAG: hypothetical protein ACFFAX_05190 [Promethearchaeota archaeon]
MTYMKKHAIPFVLIVLFFIAPAAGAPTDYSPNLVPRDSVPTRITWNVIEAPEVAFSLWFSGTGNWLAQEGSQMTFNITGINGDVEGQLELGNVTLTANDTDIAKDLTLGVWGLTPWHPGLVVKIGDSNFESLNQTAFAAAERVAGNYLNGTLVSSFEPVESNGVLYDCIVFEYEQDPTGFGEPQMTSLAYDTETGVLVKANTSYSFGTPYTLILELEGIHIPTEDPVLLWVAVAIAGVVLIMIAVAIRTRK